MVDKRQEMSHLTDRRAFVEALSLLEECFSCLFLYMYINNLLFYVLVAFYLAIQ